MPQIQTGNLSKEQVLTALIKYALEMLQAYGRIDTNIPKLLENNQVQIKTAALSGSSIDSFYFEKSEFTLPLGIDLSGVNKGTNSRFFSDTYDANYEPGAAQAAIANVPENTASIGGAPTPAPQYFAEQPKPVKPATGQMFAKQKSDAASSAMPVKPATGQMFAKQKPASMPVKPATGQMFAKQRSHEASTEKDREESKSPYTTTSASTDSGDEKQSPKGRNKKKG